MDSAKEIQIKKTKINESDQNPINFFNQLPHQVSIDILLRLPVTSLLRLSFVCRSLNSLCRDPQLVTMHLSRSQLDQSTCLIFHSDYPIQNQLHFLQLSDDQKVRKIKAPFPISMPEFKVLGSSNGLLCLMNNLFSESIYLYNPFTRSYFELQKNYDFQDQFQDRIVVYGFGFHPITNDYKVIKIASSRHLDGGFNAHYSRQSSQVVIYSMSSNTWKNKETMPYRLEKWSSPGVLVSGRLHWVSRWGRYTRLFGRIIVSYDLVDDSFHVITNPGSSSSSSLGKRVSCHLTALDGHLCAVVPVPPGHGALDIWIMKEYGVNESWIKEYTIGVHYPVSMISDELDRSSHIWRNMFGKKLVQVLCVLKSGELLLEYRGGGLVSYDAKNGTFKDLVFDGMPRIYQTMVHVGSLVSVANFPL